MELNKIAKISNIWYPHFQCVDIENMFLEQVIDKEAESMCCSLFLLQHVEINAMNKKLLIFYKPETNTNGLGKLTKKKKMNISCWYHFASIERSFLWGKSVDEEKVIFTYLALTIPKLVKKKKKLWYPPLPTITGVTCFKQQCWRLILFFLLTYKLLTCNLLHIHNLQFDF